MHAHQLMFQSLTVQFWPKQGCRLSSKASDLVAGVRLRKPKPKPFPPKQGRRSSSMASELVAGTPAGGSAAPELPLPPALEAHVEAAYGVAPGGSRRM